MKSASVRKKKKPLVDPKLFKNINKWLDTVVKTGATFSPEQLKAFTKRVNKKRKRTLVQRVRKMRSITPVNITVKRVKEKAAEGALKLGGLLDAEERRLLSARALEKWVGKKKKVERRAA